MKKLLAWAKANPVSVVCAAIVFAALVWGVLYVLLGGWAFTAKMKGREVLLKELHNLANSPVDIPGLSPLDPVRRERIAINSPAIRLYTETLEKMKQENIQVNSLVVSRNQQNHTPMLDRLFPSPSEQSTPILAKDKYRTNFAAMLGPITETGPAWRLNAGEPVDAKTIAEALAQVEHHYLNRVIFPPKTKDKLIATELESLKARLTERLVSLLQERAESVNIYARIDPATGAPFDIGSWSNPAIGDTPAMTDLWDGQMGLWIQQDIINAIARVNGVGQADTNVVNAVVKRLLQIKVVPGYVGLEPPAPAEGATNTGAVETPKVPLVSLNTNPGVRLPANYGVSPTGRQSNSIYDVRHATVRMIVDIKRLPELYEALADVNFMVVLSTDVTEVDEFDALREGYYYGEGDCVEVELKLESIWFREWTTKLMPAEIKKSLGLAENR